MADVSSRPGARARPLAVTAIGWLFVAAGLVGAVYHATELSAAGALQPDAIWVVIVRILAIVAGAFMLRGANWARWLALAWLAYHVVLSAEHSWSDTAVHAALLAVVAYVLFLPRASAHFRTSA
jgi:hypothetical protein